MKYVAGSPSFKIKKWGLEIFLLLLERADAGDYCFAVNVVDVGGGVPS